MITTKQAIIICGATHISDMQMLSVIEKYIYDKKNVSLKINRPKTIFNIQLMNIAFESACEFYLKQ